MHLLQLFIVILSVQAVCSFVYSCEEVLYHLMNSTFEQYTKYAYVFTEEGFTNWDQLDNIFLQHGETLYNFSFIAQDHCVNMDNETQPWRIVADNPSLNCDQEFTLVLKSDEIGLVRPLRNLINKFTMGSGVFVVPQTGLLLNKMSMRGEGTISFYTGAGSGEEEERYLMKSWLCSELPDRIWSFDNVITIEADSSCYYMLQYMSNMHYYVNVFRNDRLAILSSGRSDNLQNRIGIDPIAYIEIGNFEVSDVTVHMDLTFDPNNNGFVGLMEQFAGPIDSYNVSTSVIFSTDYFEIRWRPEQLEPSEISNNQDNIIIDIQISHSNDEYECPDGYELISADDEQWCFTIYGPVPPFTGFTFVEASTLCHSKGDSLPIVTSQDINTHLADFIRDFEVLEEVWLGLICNPANSTWEWQDGQPLDYDSFVDGPGFCSESANVGIDGTNWKARNRHMPLGMVVCAQRAVKPSSTSSTVSTATSSPEQTNSIELTTFESTSIGSTSTISTTAPTTSSTAVDTISSTHSTPTITSPITSTTSQLTTTSSQTANLPTWEIVLIAIAIIFVFGICLGIFLVLRRKRLLKHKRMEEELKIRNISRQAQKLSVSTEGNDEWEIDRRFVGIDYMNKLGEGAFGCVFIGRVLAKNIPSAMGRSVVELSSLTNHNDTVAVKMLHENADAQIERDFISEIDLMKRIGYHERLVNMLACVTVSRPILLICEYCANGDLLGFLRRRRTFMLERPDETDSEEVITVKKQLMFAIQIAYGLEYLSSRGFIHRDVAARNVMVDRNEGCKIGDFGLGRSVGRENENYHAQGGKLPLKWMSPEALDKYYFSTAADVWSYGVLLFEIVTLGGVPYAGWPAVELLSRLKRGERMERPDNCSEKLFEIMCLCWSEHPSDRPTFAELRKELGDLLENVNRDDYYLKLNAHANYYVMESQASD